MKFSIYFFLLMLINLACASKRNFLREDSTVYINYGAIENFPSDEVFDGVIRIIFMDVTMERIPRIIYSLPSLIEVQAQECELSTLQPEAEIHENIQVFLLDSNKLSEVPSRAFSAMPNLRVLNLQKNQITNIAEDAFTSLSKLTVLSLNTNRITALHSNVFTDLTALEYLNLNFNQIEAIPNDLFKNNANLELALLSDNAIVTIGGTAFQGATELQEINLSGNRLQNLEATTFTGLSRLRSIDLGENSFETFEFEVCGANLYIKSLRLTNNNISRIIASPRNNGLPMRIELDNNNLGDIANLSHLNVERLNVSNNPNLCLNETSFSGLLNLEFLSLRAVNMEPVLLKSDFLASLLKLSHLDISMNNIDFGENNPDGLEGTHLSALTFLNLDSNAITNLPDSAFVKTSNLRKLLLAKNSISNVSEKAFLNLVQLNELDLSDNKISALSPQLFDELVNLKQLFLSKNQIETLPIGLFKHSLKLYRLDLSSNQISVIGDRCLPINLKSLYLTQNRMHGVELSFFEGLKQLVKLDMSKNELELFDFEVVKPCKYIRQIKLAANNISQLLATAESLQSTQPIRIYLENNLLTDISNLTHFDLLELDVSNNSRLELNPSSFSSFNNLEFLGLQAVNLNATLLQEGLLKGLSKLKTLIIASNDLRSIDLETLPRAIEYFNANEANLSEIVGFQQMVEILPRLEAVDLAGNKWSCSYWEMMRENFQTYGVYQPDFCLAY